jgi:hypothetical protein
MKTPFSSTVLILTILVLLGSCTIEKRLYRQGLNVQWKGFHQQVNMQESVQDELTLGTVIDKNRPSSIWIEKKSVETVVQTEKQLENASIHPTEVLPFHSKKNIENSKLDRKSTGITALSKTTPMESTGNIKKQHEKRISPQGVNERTDLLYSIVGIILLAVIVTLVIIGVFIGFALILKICLFLLFLLLIGALIYIFGSALF